MRAPFSRLQVTGSSMFPTLIPGQFLISFNWAYLFSSPKIKDLIVVKNQGRIIIKRVQKVNKNEAFVIGDNRKASTDSRQFGWINKDLIIGKVVYIFDEDQH